MERDVCLGIKEWLRALSRKMIRWKGGKVTWKVISFSNGMSSKSRKVRLKRQSVREINAKSKWISYRKTTKMRNRLKRPV